MMYGGGGMFSRPLRRTRKILGKSHRTKPRMMRYTRGGISGVGWTRGSSGASTSARYSGPVYCFGLSSLGVEEIVEDAVELLRALCLRGVAAPFYDGQPRVLDEGVSPRGMGDREERIVGAPDQLHRHPDL